MKKSGKSCRKRRVCINQIKKGKRAGKFTKTASKNTRKVCFNRCTTKTARKGRKGKRK